MQQTHADTQRMLAAAIFAPERPVPRFLIAANRPRARSGLDIYRNNVAAGLLNVLAARFPVVRKLAGDASFLEVARSFLAACPPRSAVLMEYGEGFPDFIQERGSTEYFLYLADIAALELARGRAYHAADASPVTAEHWGQIPVDMLGEKRVDLHPSVSLIASQFPIVTAWRTSDNAHKHCASVSGAETALVARPFLEVEVHILPAGGFECLYELQRGATIAEALGKATDAVPTLDLALNLSALIRSNIVTALR